MVYGKNPASSNNDALKLLIGDTSTSASLELLSTGECAYLISQYGSVRAAGPHAARAIAAEYARKADKEVGDLSISHSQVFDHFSKLADKLERTVSLAAIPYAGGISISDKNDVESDSDRVRPSFEIGQHDSVLNPGQAGHSSTGLAT